MLLNDFINTVARPIFNRSYQFCYQNKASATQQVWLKYSKLFKKKQKKQLTIEQLQQVSKINPIILVPFIQSSV